MENKSITDDELIQKMNDTLDQLDASRVEEMEVSKNLLEKKHNAQIKERKRLLRKYGGEHPEVKKLEARLTSNEAMLPAIDAGIEHLKTPTAPFLSTSWRVHGFVSSDKGNSLPGITIFLTDEKQQPLRTMPYACSDSKGYYAITLDKNQVTELKNTNIFLAVLSQEKRPVAASKEPMVASQGKIDYRDIIVEEGQCASPFEEDTGISDIPK